MNALVDVDNDSKSPNSNKRLYEDEISDQLLHVPTGHHYLILYPNIETMRKVYVNYIKKQLKEQPSSVVLFLSYYDTTDTVRSALSEFVRLETIGPYLQRRGHISKANTSEVMRFLLRASVEWTFTLMPVIY